VTIAILLWLGVSAERAFDLSFLIALPAVLGAELLDARHSGLAGLSVLYATFIAFVVGVGTLLVLRGVLVRRVVYVFAIYLVPLGLATLAWGYARP